MAGLVTLGLLLAYVVLAGEAIHCRYFADPHERHGNSQSPANTHATHCIAANHGATAIPSITALAPHSLPLIESVSSVERNFGRTVFVASTPARAPPFA